MKRFLCRVFGHRWTPVWPSKTKTYSMVACGRCSQPGWVTWDAK